MSGNVLLYLQAHVCVEGTTTNLKALGLAEYCGGTGTVTEHQGLQSHSTEGRFLKGCSTPLGIWCLSITAFQVYF